MNVLDLSGLVAARLCHDLANPIGAVGNGLELAMLTGGTEEVNMASAANNSALGRLKLLRVALGPAGSDPAPQAEMEAHLDHWRGESRVEIAWDTTVATTRAELKRIWLAILCLADALPGKGSISVTRSGAHWSIIGTHSELAPEPALWDVARGTANGVAIRPSQVQYALLAQSAGPTLAIETEDGRIAIRF